MNRIARGILFIVLMVSLLSTGCRRRFIDMDYTDDAEVSVVLDWTKAQLDPNGATLLFYNEDGTSPTTKISHLDTITVSLKAGVYSVIAFNETFEDFDYISFRNTNRFSTIEAFVQEDGTKKSTGDVVSSNPDILATAVVEQFEVTSEMVKETRNRSKAKTKSTSLSDELTLKLQPRRVVYPALVTAYVNGINKISSAGAYITGFAESVFLGAGRTSIYSTTQKMTFTETNYDDDSNCNGLMRGTFNCFGLRNEEDLQAITGYNLDFRAALKDGRLFAHSVSINDNISVVEDIEAGVQILVQAGLPPDGGGLAGDSIVIPELEGESGFGVGVGEWEDVVIPIELENAKNIY